MTYPTIRFFYIPLTRKSAEKDDSPARFLAIQVNSPICSFEAHSIDKVLTFLLTLAIDIPSTFSADLLFCSQMISIGKSPLLMEQIKEVDSPELMVPSPNSKGRI